MRRLWLAFAVLFGLTAAAAAQGCGQGNPNCIVPTAPAGTSNNQAASTAFVQGSVASILGTPNTWTALQTFNGGAAVIGANTSGLTTDFGQFIVQNSATTASGVYSGASPFLYSDGVRSTVVVTNGSTVGNVNGFGAYVLNQSTTGPTNGNGVGFFSVVISAVNGAATWGLNPACNDTTNNASTATSNRQCNGYEFDCTLATNNAGSGCQGATVIINGLFGEQKGGNAFQVGAVFPASPANAEANAHWTNSFVSPDGVTMASGANQGAALLVGSSVRHSASNANSQTILFNRWLSGTEHQDTLVDSASGTLNWGGAAIASPVYVATGAVFGTSAGQIAYGGTTVAAGANTCPSGTVGTQTVQGCEVHNVAGTTRYVPFF